MLTCTMCCNFSHFFRLKFYFAKKRKKYDWHLRGFSLAFFWPWHTYELFFFLLYKCDLANRCLGLQSLGGRRHLRATTSKRIELNKDFFLIPEKMWNTPISVVFLFDKTWDTSILKKNLMEGRILRHLDFEIFS